MSPQSHFPSQEQNLGCRDKYLAKLGQHKRILDFESEILLDAGNFLTKQALAHIIIFLEKKKTMLRRQQKQITNDSNIALHT